MEPAALLKPSGKNVASVNHFCAEKKILLEPAYGKFTVATPAEAVPGSTVHVNVCPVDQLS